jgi:hypothetical protein
MKGEKYQKIEEEIKSNTKFFKFLIALVILVPSLIAVLQLTLKL